MSESKSYSASLKRKKGRFFFERLDWKFILQQLFPFCICYFDFLLLLLMECKVFEVSLLVVRENSHHYKKFQPRSVKTQKSGQSTGKFVLGFFPVVGARKSRTLAQNQTKFRFKRQTIIDACHQLIGSDSYSFFLIS